jgi:hypothetical protein
VRVVCTVVQVPPPAGYVSLESHRYRHVPMSFIPQAAEMVAAMERQHLVGVARISGFAGAGA